MSLGLGLLIGFSVLGLTLWGIFALFNWLIREDARKIDESLERMRADYRARSDARSSDWKCQMEAESKAWIESLERE